MLYHIPDFKGRMVKTVDTTDLKSVAHPEHVGSIPTLATIIAAQELERDIVIYNRFMNPLFIIYAGISGTFSTQIFDASVTINLSLINLLDKDQRDALWRNYILKF